MISGGLDSACIYSILCDELEVKKINTYSMNFNDNKGEVLACDETYFQDLIVDGSTHEKIDFREISPYSKVDLWLERFDQPFNLANAYLWEETFNRVAKNQNVQIFDGLDGDTVISHGWERLKELFKFSQKLFSKKRFFFTRW